LPLRISSTNKRIADEVAIIPSKRLRNKIAGFTTHLMKRIQKGPVRGISFKLQEEERERKDNYVPEVSAIAVPEGGLEIDPDTKVRLFCSCRPLLQFSGRLG
jgi:small subunit ribosomal protein S17e